MPFDAQSTWANFGSTPSQHPSNRTDLISRIYATPHNPLRRVKFGTRCSGFPWSITAGQLQQIVDPVIERHARTPSSMITFIEAGVFWGGTTVRLAERLLARFPYAGTSGSAAVISIDTWLGDLVMWSDPRWAKGALHPDYGAPTDFACFAGAVKRSQARDLVVPLRLPSHMAARLLYHRNVRADLIYVDGSHDYSNVLEDLEAFTPLLQGPCGVLFGDDYHIPNVRAAVDQWANRTRQQLRTIEMRKHAGITQMGWWFAPGPPHLCL